MRILILGEASSLHVQRWSSWFARRGHEVHLISVSQAEVPEVTVHSFPAGGTVAFPVKAIAIRRAVRAIAPDLLQSHPAVGYGLWGALAGFHPFVVSAWGSDVLLRPEESWAQAYVLRYVIRRADFCVPVAEHLLTRMTEYGLRRESAEVIPMGVDLAAFPPKAYRRGTRARSFVSARMLEPVYDLPTLLRASQRLFKADPNLQGAIIGDGSQRKPLEGLAADLGIMGRLTFTGALPPVEVFRRFAEAAVYVSASKSDGASVALLEAMSQGAFPVVTDIAANREWVVHGENGLLFPVGDDKALASRVTEALRDEVLLERASERNLDLVARRGDLNRNLERVEVIYRRLAMA